MVGELRRCVAIYIMALAVNLALNMTLIPVYGLYGVAIATSGAMVFEALALHFTDPSQTGHLAFCLCLRSVEIRKSR